ncbi:MAG TPA: tRNA (N(6)-L-threonylcarbamoyladenosine(37)-C(2))-methylthiotransferase MtaB [Terriglobales bacterium]|nr:tRNA (N(6)-L-threonylcarbamoyladenosine(37)-C(2))-methylthiotransferase MtaB [Terriglobales bacterium]
MATFYVENFGCRATQADGAALERQFRDRGMARALHVSEADIVVLNTCTVTASADRDARAAIRRVHRQNPQCRIVVTGCYAQRAPEEISALPGVTEVVGNSHKHELVSIAVPVQSAGTKSDEAGQRPTSEDQRPIFVSDIFAHTQLLAAPVFDAANQRTRPILKVQDGCDNRCSFCIIPQVRGSSRSLPLPQILREVNTLVAAGYREVVISGINLGRWGRDLARPSRFENLVRAILDHTSLEKLRISSVEPMDWSDEFIALMAQSPRIAKHAHVPMQSASDRVLRLMHRKYRPWHYREKLEKIRAAMPAAAIGADVMVGFPGETDNDFQQTLRMVEELPFTYLHVFTYSARPGTPAAVMKNQVPAPIASERNRVLRELADAKKQAFLQSFVDKQISAITLNESDAEHTECLTDNYLKLWLRGKHEANRWVSARVLQSSSGALTGSIEQTA